MRTREEIEQLEEGTLASYAMKSKDARPRFYNEPKHETRTCYQRDRDRVVHSEAFRKLEYKTQVFVIFEGDYYRTRLTHTLEVAQIARSIGRNLQLNEDLIEAIALAHDLGHSPFGHAGENALDEIMKKKGLRFNHNHCSYEVVTEREKRYPNFPGLNLTGEVRVGILKHETKYDAREGGKIDVPSFEEDCADDPTIEARVVDIADSLAYLNHDIDDGLTSGYITEHDLAESSLWTAVLNKIESNLSDNDREMLKYQIVKELIDTQIKDLLKASTERLEKISLRSSDEAKRYKEKIIEFSTEMAHEREILQELLNTKLYHHYRVQRMTSKAKRIIEDLFSAYIKNMEQLPPSAYKHNLQGNKKDKKSQYKIVCDYIASMTDRAAFDEHKKLFNPYEKV